jgi:hypothetical protein
MVFCEEGPTTLRVFEMDEILETFALEGSQVVRKYQNKMRTVRTDDVTLVVSVSGRL